MFFHGKTDKNSNIITIFPPCKNENNEVTNYYSIPVF